MNQFTNRAALWLNQLAPNAPLMTGLCPSVQVADADFNGETARFIAVVPDANNHYPRAAQGEVGLLEGWTLAKVVNETIDADADNAVKRPIIAVIDVPSQAYGRREEAFGIHQALAGAAGAYASIQGMGAGNLMRKPLATGAAEAGGPDFSALLGKALDATADVTLAEEIDMQRLYLDIEKMRFEERLRAVAAADLALAVYNPASKTRREQLVRARRARQPGCGPHREALSGPGGGAAREGDGVAAGPLASESGGENGVVWWREGFVGKKFFFFFF